MRPTSSRPSSKSVDNLLKHLQYRTFGRLHELRVTRSADGKLRVSGVAHSRFVRQLAEWAMTDCDLPDDVQLSISVHSPTCHTMEVEK